MDYVYDGVKEVKTENGVDMRSYGLYTEESLLSIE